MTARGEQDHQRRDAPSPSHAQTPAAWKSPLPIAVFLMIAVVALVADLWTKHAVFRSLLDQPEAARRVEMVRASLPTDTPPDQILRYVQLQRRLIPGIQLTLSTNPGVVFGFKPHEAPAVRKIIVASATVICMGLVLVFFACSDRSAWVSHTALALILAGALGNLYDRTLAKVYLPGMPDRPITGQVRDFVDASELHYPYIFNIADVWLVIGVGLLIIHWGMTHRADAKAKAS